MAQLCTYARIDSLEVPFTGDLMDSWEDPASFFLMNGDSRHSSNHHYVYISPTILAAIDGGILTMEWSFMVCQLASTSRQCIASHHRWVWLV